MTTCIASDTLIEEHVALARSIANRLARKYRITSRDERDEMRGDAELGLVQAARAWREDRGVPFGKFAWRRIAGAVHDGLRSRENKIPTISLDDLEFEI